VAKGVPGRLRPRIFSTFGTTRVVGRQPYAPAAFTQDKSLVLIFRGRVDPRAHGSVGKYGKKSPITSPGIDPETVRLVAQFLNHYTSTGIWKVAANVLNKQSRTADKGLSSSTEGLLRC
jgi:hypothetical protein